MSIGTSWAQMPELREEMVKTLLLKRREGTSPNTSCVNTSTSVETPEESKKVSPLQSRLKEHFSCGQGSAASSVGGTQA